MTPVHAPEASAVAGTPTPETAGWRRRAGCPDWGLCVWGGRFWHTGDTSAGIANADGPPLRPAPPWRRWTR